MTCAAVDPLGSVTRLLKSLAIVVFLMISRCLGRLRQLIEMVGNTKVMQNARNNSQRQCLVHVHLHDLSIDILGGAFYLEIQQHVRVHLCSASANRALVMSSDPLCFTGVSGRSFELCDCVQIYYVDAC